MKMFLIAFLAFMSIATPSKAHAQWCTSSAKISAESSLALDNLMVLEDELNYFHPENAYLTTADISSLRVILGNVLNIADDSYNTCLNIKSAFYTTDIHIYNLSKNINFLMGTPRNRAPLAPYWDTFINSFLILEQTIERTPGRFHVPRGPFYRRYFPGFVVRYGIGFGVYPGTYSTHTYGGGRRNIRGPHRTRYRRSIGTRQRVERRQPISRIDRQSRPSRRSRPPRRNRRRNKR